MFPFSQEEYVQYQTVGVCMRKEKYEKVMIYSQKIKSCFSSDSTVSHQQRPALSLPWKTFHEGICITITINMDSLTSSSLQLAFSIATWKVKTNIPSTSIATKTQSRRMKMALTNSSKEEVCFLSVNEVVLVVETWTRVWSPYLPFCCEPNSILDVDKHDCIHEF